MQGLDNPAATGGTALLSTLAIQALKNSSWASWFNRDSARANFALSLFISFIATVGVHYTWDANTGTLMITGLTLAGLAHGVWSWLLQWLTQHATYKGFVVPAETLGEIRALLQRQWPPAISATEAKSGIADAKSQNDTHSVIIP